MRAWLTSKTQTFGADMQAYDVAQRAEWAAESKWATGVYANIANPALSKAEKLWLDGEKQQVLALMTQTVADWEDSAVSYDNQFCTDTLGPDQAFPGETTDSIDICPPSLRAATFAISYGILNIAATCEKLSIKVTGAGFLAPFGKLTFATNGDITAVLGEKAGGSLGPLSANADAGVYVTVNGASIVDAGVTVSGKIGDGPIRLAGSAKLGTASFVNVDATIITTLDATQD